MTPELSPEIIARLDQLRDIRLPDPVGWWPLAPGWWLLLALIVTSGIAAVLWDRLRRRQARYLALQELDTMPDDDTLATGISSLLRRVARRKTQGAVTLTADAWRDFLSAGKDGLPTELAAYLATAPYAGPTLASPGSDALRSAAAKWIRRRNG